jgi:hypothetical protein
LKFAIFFSFRLRRLKIAKCAYAAGLLSDNATWQKKAPLPIATECCDFQFEFTASQNETCLMSRDKFKSDFSWREKNAESSSNVAMLCASVFFSSQQKMSNVCPQRILRPGWPDEFVKITQNVAQHT